MMLQIHGKKFINFNEGTLGDVTTTTGQFPNEVLNFYNKSPGLDGSKNFIISNRKMLTFGISDEMFDAGQSTLPYFDGSGVTFDIPAPIGGIKLFHYTNNGDKAGFIRPSLDSMDYRKQLIYSFSAKSYAENIKFETTQISSAQQE